MPHERVEHVFEIDEPVLVREAQVEEPKQHIRLNIMNSPRIWPRRLASRKSNWHSCVAARSSFDRFSLSAWETITSVNRICIRESTKQKDTDTSIVDEVRKPRSIIRYKKEIENGA